jgi:hypothetical protein
MKIKKKFQGIIPENKILNEKSTSETDTYSCKYIDDNREIYSTEEIRIGSWIDGKPLYRKTVIFGSLPNASSKYIKHNISNIDFIASIKGVTTQSNGAAQPLPYSSSTLEKNVQLYADKTIIEITTGRDDSSKNAYITLKYTKTTD